VKNKTKKGKTIIKQAQELVAKKCGIVQEDKEMDSMTLQQYLDMYKQPLLNESMEAIVKLIEMTEEKKKKKMDKKKKKIVEAEVIDACKEAKKKKQKKIVEIEVNDAGKEAKKKK
jgi:hypothetical protein